MRFRETYRYEVGYLLRRPSTWIYGALLTLLTVWMSLGTFDEAPYLFNGPLRLAGIGIQVGLFGLLVSAALFSSAVLRDFESEIDPLLFTTPISKVEYLGGRYLAALSVNAILLLAVPLGEVIASLLPFYTAEQVGPYRFLAYLQPYVLFQLPNLAFTGIILFAVAALGRRLLPVYLGGIGILIGYVVTLNFPDWLGDPKLAALTDPLGLNILQVLSRSWTVAEQNGRLVGFPVVLVGNRLFWLLITGVVTLVVGRWFRFAHLAGSGGAGSVAAPDEGEAPSSVAFPRVTGRFAARDVVRQGVAIATQSIREIAMGKAFLAVLALVCGYALLTTWNVGSTVFDTSTWPVTFLVAEEGLLGRTGPLIILLIALFTGELVWKDRDVGAGEMVDAAPIPEGAVVAGRGMALVAMVVALHLMYLVAGLALQTMQGYHHYELGLYLKIVLGLNLLDSLIVAALALAVHVVVNRKALAHFAVILLWGAAQAAPVVHIYHHLLRYGTAPAWTYSDMNGFGPTLLPYLSFKLYWGAWALLLVALAALLWPRGRETGWRWRLREARARMTGPLARAVVVAAALVLGLGGFVFYNTNILHDFRTPDTAGEEQVRYEERYRQYLDLPQPTLTDAKLTIELHPEVPAVELSGTYRLVNRTGASIDSVHLTFLDQTLAVHAINFDRPSTPVLVDDEAGYRIYALAEPLAPGDSLGLTFDLAYAARGFRDGKSRLDVVRNGSHLDRRLLPMIGYQPAGEYTDEAGRVRYGLGPRPDTPDADDVAARGMRWGIRNEDRSGWSR